MLSPDFYATVDGAGSRACGCAWRRIPSAEAPWVRPSVDGTAVLFVRRCGPHRVMCRGLEQWEMDLLGEVMS